MKGLHPDRASLPAEKHRAPSGEHEQESDAAAGTDTRVGPVEAAGYRFHGDGRVGGLSRVPNIQRAETARSLRPAGLRSRDRVTRVHGTSDGVGSLVPDVQHAEAAR